MKMIQKLKSLERAVVFLRWATDAQFGRIKYVGEDFIEFEILDTDSMEYTETVIINSQLLLEAIVSGYEVARIIAEISVNLAAADTGKLNEKENTD